MATAHIIGAGVAGLSAALELSKAQYRVVMYEQTGHAGGRCRSFHDPALDAIIDNGNHLLLSGNKSALSYLETVNALDELIGPDTAAFPFVDVATRERWTIELNKGPMPWWILDKDRRVPGTRLSEYLTGLKLLSAGNRTVKQLFAGQGALYERFWDPFTVGVMNTLPEEAAARLLTPVIRETLARGADYSRPMISKRGLSFTFVDPALKWLEARGADIRLNCRVSGIEDDGNRVTAIVTGQGREEVKPGDVVVSALPAWFAGMVLGTISAPDAFVPIVNVHYRVENARMPLMKHHVLGLLNSMSHWLFVRDDVASVTISAGDKAAAMDRQELLAMVWREIAPEMDQDPDQLPGRTRVLTERRATFKGTVEQLSKRPAPPTKWHNLVLAGDWVDNGLPSTIEGSIRSGQTAAHHLLKVVSS
ncbi:MAG: hydroxysqualene dehydroxylase HpnE [Anderseniella sp.]|nr:hydroxysqualene dehydroxylase HpnE [Anderseniella sp.]